VGRVNCRVEKRHVLAERREPPGIAAQPCCPGAKNNCADASVHAFASSGSRAGRLTTRIRSEHAISLCGRAIAYGSAENDAAVNEHVLAERRKPPGSDAETCRPGAKNNCVDASVGRSHRAARWPGGSRRIRSEHAISLCGRAIAYGSAVNDVAVFVSMRRFVAPIERLANRAAYATPLKNAVSGGSRRSALSRHSRFAAEPSPTARR
jgi:hypothetical protein